MKLKLKRNLILGIFVLISTMVFCSGCPGDDDDDEEANGGMCFYDLGGNGGSMSGCWQFATEEECLDEIEDICALHDFDILNWEFVGGCSMCDDCNPDWYDI